MKQTHDRIFYNQVDLILFKEGSFSPLNWLLTEGQLEYNDYQRWRKGEIEYLEDVIKTSIAEIITTLERIQEYAHLLQLVPSKDTYFSNTFQPLRFSHSQTNELIFTTSYEPAEDRVQLDLFFDSAPACVEFDLITAIVNKRCDDISSLLTKLTTINLEKHKKFIQFLDFEKIISQSNNASNKKINLLVEKISPLAFDILGRYAHDYITPLWHQLSDEIKSLHFDADKPNHHLSFTAFMGFQWRLVMLSIEQEKNWIKQPILIFRYAETCYKLNQEQKSIELWLKIFILFPETAKHLINDTCNYLLFCDWQTFSELDPELELSLFPAWLLMNKPALTKKIILSDFNGNEPMQLIQNLVCNAESEINETTIKFRTRLKNKYPSFFDHYMKDYLTEKNET